MNLIYYNRKLSQGPHYLDSHGGLCASVSSVEWALLWGCDLGFQPGELVLEGQLVLKGSSSGRRGEIQTLQVSELLLLAQGTSSFITVTRWAGAQAQNRYFWPLSALVRELLLKLPSSGEIKWLHPERAEQSETDHINMTGPAVLVTCKLFRLEASDSSWLKRLKMTSSEASNCYSPEVPAAQRWQGVDAEEKPKYLHTLCVARP